MDGEGGCCRCHFLLPYHAWQFTDHDLNNLVSNVIIAVSVFFFLLLYWCKIFLNCFERGSYKGKLLPWRKCARCKKNKPKVRFLCLFYLSCNTVRLRVTWNSNARTSCRTLDNSQSFKSFQIACNMITVQALGYLRGRPLCHMSFPSEPKNETR